MKKVLFLMSHAGSGSGVFDFLNKQENKLAIFA
jgi:hypothetical protein